MFVVQMVPVAGIVEVNAMTVKSLTVVWSCAVDRRCETTSSHVKQRLNSGRRDRSGGPSRPGILQKLRALFWTGGKGGGGGYKGQGKRNVRIRPSA